MNEKALIDEIKPYLKDLKYVISKASRTSFPSPLTECSKGSDQEKIALIEEHFRSILEIIGFDLSHESLCETPKRVAKMWVEELFRGIKEDTFPKLTFIPLDSKNQKIPVYTYDISIQSTCEHHLLPMTGTAHVGYIPHEKIIGLSKLNRIMDYFSKRAQLQERLTLQIADCLSYILDTEDIALYMKLKHDCVHLRGAKDTSQTVTSIYLGKFKEDSCLRQEFLTKIPR